MHISSYWKEGIICILFCALHHQGRRKRMGQSRQLPLQLRAGETGGTGPPGPHEYEFLEGTEGDLMHC